MPVYRYKLVGQNVDRLKGVLPVGASVVGGSIGAVVFWDVTADASAKADLDLAMAEAGWEFVSTDPSSTPIEQAATENLHAPEHIKDGNDEVDGDKLDIDFTPLNYTPDTSPAEVDDVDHLSAHLKGVDNVLSVGAALNSATTGFPNLSDSAISRTDGTRTFTIQPTGASFDFYAGGTKYTKSVAQNKVWADSEGLHVFYFDTSGVLQETTSFTDALYLSYAIVAIIYWDATSKVSIIFEDERHGLIMDGQTHLHFHKAFHAQWISGLALGSIIVGGNGNDNAHARFAVTNGVIRDEDLEFSIQDDSPQDLSPIAQIPILYRSGASGDWRKKTADDYPIVYQGTAGYPATQRLPVNEFTGGVWTFTQVANNGFVCGHYFATNNVDEPFVGIQGQIQYGNLSAAQAGALTELRSLVLAGLPLPEMVPIATVIFQTSSSYSNTPKARIVSTADGGDYIDYRRADLGGAGSTGVDFVADLPTCQVRRTTQQTFTTSYVAVSWDTEDIENDATLIEHTAIDPTKITVKEDGLYLFYFNLPSDCTGATSEDIWCYAQLFKNDVAIVGTETWTGNHYSASAAMWEGLSIVGIYGVELAAGDAITLKIKRGGSFNTLTMEPNATFGGIRMRGTKGDKGDTGSGSSINAEEDGTPLGGGPFDTINLAGGVVGSDGGGGTLDVQGGLLKTDFAEVASDTTTTSTTPTPLLSKSYTKLHANSDLLIHVSASGSVDNNDKYIRLRLDIDATPKRGMSIIGKANKGDSGAIIYRATGLAAGVRSIVVQWWVESDTGQIRPVTTDYEHCSLSIEEVLV
jgi:hypothetical protein